MRLTYILLLLCIASAVAKKNLKTRKVTGIRRAATAPKSNGPCINDACADPNEVCQTTDGNCYPKDTPGLDPNNTNPPVGNFPVGRATAGCTNKNFPGRASDCPQVQYLCNNSVYYQLMTEQCPITCKRGCASGR